MASSIFYSSTSNSYTLMVKCEITDSNIDYTLQIGEECNSEIDIEDFDEQISL